MQESTTEYPGAEPTSSSSAAARVGSRLAAQRWTTKAIDVTVIDTDVYAFRRLPDTFHGRTILGTGIDEDVLRRAGIEAARTFIAVTNNDNPNIMAAQIAQTVFRVPEVLARVYDVERAQTYAELGMKTICPTATIAQMFREQVTQRRGAAGPPSGDGIRERGRVYRSGGWRQSRLLPDKDPRQ